MGARTCHIVLDSPTGPLDGIEAGDVVADLRLGAANDRLEPNTPGEKVRVVTTDVAERQYHDAARDAYVAWIAQVGDRPVVDGRSLKELFAYRETFSLWWLLPLRIKHYVKHPLPGLVQRLVWLDEAASEASEVLEFAASAEQVVIWAEERLACTTMWRVLQKRLPESASSKVRFVGMNAKAHPSGAGMARLAERAVNRADATIRRVGQLGGFLGGMVRQKLRETTSFGMPSRVDVALTTELPEWTRVTDEDGSQRFVHRYLADAPTRLAKAGLQVCWLPVVDRHEKLDALRERLADQPLPVAWDAAEAGIEASTRAVVGLAGLQKTFREVRERLDGHPALEFRGVDVSEWIISELAAEIDVHGLYHLQRFEMARAALERVRPEVVLYRNEFYASGLAIAAAAAGVSERWAFQHATIPHHHWVYQHSARELGERHDVVHHLPAPDRFLAYGSFVRELMSRYGYPADTIELVGSLRHDEMFERADRVDEAARRQITERLGFPKDRPVLLICAQLPAWLADWIGLVVAALEQLGETAHVVVKPHWYYKDIAGIHQSFEHLGWSDYAIYEGDLQEALLAADVSLTGSSTTGLESAILGTPLISFQREQPWETMPYVEDGLALPAADLDSMVHSLQMVMSPEFEREWPERRRKFLERHLLNVSQPAVGKLVELLADR